MKVHKIDGGLSTGWTEAEVPFLKSIWWILLGRITRGQGCWVLEEAP